MDWQTTIALSIVALASGLLLRSALRFVSGTRKSGCASCPSNSQASRLKNLPLVQLGGPRSVNKSQSP